MKKCNTQSSVLLTSTGYIAAIKWRPLIGLNTRSTALSTAQLLPRMIDYSDRCKCLCHGCTFLAQNMFSFP